MITVNLLSVGFGLCTLRIL